MSYEVRCECGKAHPVSATDAGASLPCGCGRTVEVPPLHELCAAAGQTPLSADAQLPLMLLRGDLPGTDTCVCCGRTTTGLVVVDIVCERAEVKRVGRGGPIGCFILGLLLGWIVLIRESRDEKVVGRDVAYSVPLRVCEQCDDDLRSAGNLRGALRQTPIYAALLDKYPNARITRRG